MGFKLNKKNASENTHQSNSVFVTKLKAKVDQFSKLFGDTEQTRSYLQLGLISLLVSVLILLYLVYSVPRNNDLTRSMGELRLLSQTMSRQASEAMSSGTKESIHALTNAQKEYNLLYSTVNGFAVAVGFTIAIIIMAGIREKMEYNDIPKAFQGMPIVLITAGLMAIAFFGFSGLL